MRLRRKTGVPRDCAAGRPRRRFPSPRGLREVFPPDRFPHEHQPNQILKVSDPDAFEASRRRHLARLFAQPEHRTATEVFEAARIDAKVKRLVGESLDELDGVVLSPPCWSHVDVPARRGSARR